MSDLDEFLSGIRDKMRGVLGEEGLEQQMLDEIWFQETFKNQCISNLYATNDLLSHGASNIYIINSAFYSGINTYRNYLISRGVDVLALEGRTE